MKITAFAVTVAMATAAHAQTVNESAIFGVLTVRPAPSACQVKYVWHPMRGLPIPTYSAGCTKADIESHVQTWVHSVRLKFGDPGRH
jgi:hypothetical protein